MKEVIKQLKEDLRIYKEDFREAKKYKEWQHVAQLAIIIEYIEDLICTLKG